MCIGVESKNILNSRQAQNLFNDRKTNFISLHTVYSRKQYVLLLLL